MGKGWSVKSQLYFPEALSQDFEYGHQKWATITILDIQLFGEDQPFLNGRSGINFSGVYVLHLILVQYNYWL